jgi:hypothetical protein
VPIQTFDDVIARLTVLVDEGRHEQARWAYFAALYRTVTRNIRDAARGGHFQDPVLIERLDITFANRYFDALAAWRAKINPTASWLAVMQASGRDDLLLLDHLLLGMNAHINLDLPVAAVEVAPGTLLANLREDFSRLNQILLSMIERQQQVLNSLSPWLGVLDWAGGHYDEQLARWGLRGAREIAWQHAENLASAANKEQEIHRLDTNVAGLAKLVVEPGWLIGAAKCIVRRREESDPAVILAALSTA